jgi:hypothetical protein
MSSDRQHFRKTLSTMGINNAFTILEKKHATPVPSTTTTASAGMDLPTPITSPERFIKPRASRKESTKCSEYSWRNASRSPEGSRTRNSGSRDSWRRGTSANPPNNDSVYSNMIGGQSSGKTFQRKSWSTTRDAWRGPSRLPKGVSFYVSEGLPESHPERYITVTQAKEAFRRATSPIVSKRCQGFPKPFRNKEALDFGNILPTARKYYEYPILEPTVDASGKYQYGMARVVYCCKSNHFCVIYHDHTKSFDNGGNFSIAKFVHRARGSSWRSRSA